MTVLCLMFLHFTPYSLSLDIEDIVVRVTIVGVVLTFRSLTQEALETVRLPD